MADRPPMSCRCPFWSSRQHPSWAWQISFLILCVIMLGCEAQTPADGAVYIGYMSNPLGAAECRLQAPSGIRIFLDRWPTEARIQFYPRTTAQKQCTGEFKLTGVWYAATAQLQLTATELVQQNCDYALFSLGGTFSADLKTFSGQTQNSQACAGFIATLQNSWGAAPACGPLYYKSMGATFACDAISAYGSNGTGSVKQFVEANSVTRANFYLPQGLNADSVTIATSVGAYANLMVNFTMHLVDEAGQDVTNATGKCSSQLTGFTFYMTCQTWPGTLAANYYIHFNSTRSDDATLTITYSYVKLKTQCVSPIGCSLLDSAEASRSARHWGRLALQTYGSISSSSNWIPSEYLEDSWAVPWYLWRRWYEQIIDTTSPWSPYYYQSFAQLDVNNDGYASVFELSAAIENLEPACPTGYYKDSMIVIGCIASSNAHNFSLEIDNSQHTINLPVGISNWLYKVSSQTTNLDISMQDHSTGTVIISKDSTEIVNASKTGVWIDGGGVSLTWSGDATAPPYVEYIHASGTTTRPVTLLMHAPIVNGEGGVEFSHQGVSPCPPIPTGCAPYDGPQAAAGAEMLMKGLRDIVASGTAADAWNWAVSKNYIILGWGISTSTWNMMWRYLLYPGAAAGRRLHQSTEAAKQQNWDTLQSINRMAFAYCDTDSDFMITEAEFTVCYNSNIYCPDGYHQFNSILFRCDPYNGSFTHKASMGRTYELFRIPVSGRDFAVTMHAMQGSLVGSLPQGLEISLSSGADNTSCVLSNNGTHLSCPGVVGTRVHVFLTTPAAATPVTIQLHYSYGASDREVCPTDVHYGCQAYVRDTADAEVLQWSQLYNAEYADYLNAWNLDASKYVIPGLGIPYSNWLHLGCRPAAPSSYCNVRTLGRTFFKIDLDRDGYIDDLSGSPEFVIAFRMSGAFEVTYASTCLGFSQYDSSMFPMTGVNSRPGCRCDAKLGMGWDRHLEACVSDRETDCTTCPNQAKCAYLSTAIGDGLQDFQGNCILHDSEDCFDARKASLSYPVGIAVDELDNVYIADYGNNRVRMVSATTGWVTTIAGNGLMGFSGDGGFGPDAMLRYPEAVAVNMVGCSTTVQREVYFTDSMNQRIRKVVHNGTHWYIHTIAGTGEKGENPYCDSGCPALEAIFNNPRSISLSNAGDLYIADSGNRKIRRLRDGSISTFVGSGVQVSSRFRFNMAEKGSLLPGHWSQANLDVALQSLYFLKVDHQDNLWYVDGANNRLFMSPLSQTPEISYSGMVGKFLKYYTLHFLGRSASQNLTLMSTMSAGLTTWLGVENITVTPRETTTPSSFQVGHSYWRYALSDVGAWCDARTFNSRAKCKPSKAQLTSFQQIMGFCFDVANEMYATDRVNSEVVKIQEASRVSLLESEMYTVVEERRTTEDCACLKYWVDWQNVGQGVNGPDLWKNVLNELQNGDIPMPTNGYNAKYQMCRDNPDVIKFLSRYYADASVFMNILPPCTVTNYCKDDAPVPWCFINTTDLAQNHPCTPTNPAEVWGFCYQPHLVGVEWQEKPMTALYGNEMRQTQVSSHYAHNKDFLSQTFFPEFKSAIAWDTHKFLRTQLPDAGTPTSISGTQGSDTGTARWSILLGVEEPKIQNLVQGQPDVYLYQIWDSVALDGMVCDTTCCGLSTATTQDGKTYCVINNQQDFDVAETLAKGVAVLFPGVVSGMFANAAVPSTLAEEFFLAYQQRITFVWSAPDAFGTVESCEEKCSMSKECKAFMTYPQIPVCIDDVDPADDFCSGEDYCAAPDKVNCGIQTFIRGSTGESITCDCTGCGTPPNAMCTREPGTYNCLTFRRTDPYEVYTLNRTTMELSYPMTTQPLQFGTVTDLYVNTVDAASQSNVNDFLSGPHDREALLIDACVELCKQLATCATIVFPGCYLFSRETWGPSQQGNSPSYQTKLFVKVNAEESVVGVAGLPRVYAFQADMEAGTDTSSSSFNPLSALASFSFVNKPSSCEVNSKGEVLFADTWNQRIRKISNVNPLCHHQTELFTPDKIQQYIDKLNNVSDLCSAEGVFPADTWKLMQMEAVKGRSTNMFYTHLCKDAGLEDTDLQTTNVLILCQICALYSTSQRPSHCPSVELCSCRQAFVEVLTTEVFLNCPDESSFNDPWHRLLTAYIGCWTTPDRNLASFLTEQILIQSLRYYLELGARAQPVFVASL